MAQLLNLARSDDRPLFVDPLSITAVHVCGDAQEQLTIFNDNGLLLWIDFREWGVDPALLVDKLEAAGNPLVPFPLRTSGGSSLDAGINLHYIAPRAVAFATVTPVSDNGTLGAIIGVKGVGRDESYNIRPEEFQALLGGMKAAGKTLVRYEPDIAYSRWPNAAALYIDPAAVQEIRDDGSQVNVRFDGIGSIDIQTRGRSRDEAERVNSQVFSLLDRHGMQTAGATQSPYKDLHDIWAEAQRIVKADKDDARIRFAEGIAQAHGGLTRIINVREAVFVRPDDFTYVTFRDEDCEGGTPEYRYIMMLNRQRTQDDPYPEAVRLCFNSAAKRAESFAALTGGGVKPAPGRKPPAP